MLSFKRSCKLIYRNVSILFLNRGTEKVNKKIVRNYMDRVWNEKDAGAIREAFSPSVVLHSPLGSFQGREELEKIFRHWLQAFPDLRVSFEKVFRDDDHVLEVARRKT